jgi:hypothetical protein
MVEDAGYGDYVECLDEIQTNFDNKPGCVSTALFFYLDSSENYVVYHDLGKLSDDDNKERFYRIIEDALGAGSAVGIMIDMPGPIEHYVRPWDLRGSDVILEVVVLKNAIDCKNFFDIAE